MANAPIPVKPEWEALWAWHREQQYLMANKEDYAAAEGHKRRAAEIRSYIHGDQPDQRPSAPTPPQEPSANPPMSPPTVSGSLSGVTNQAPPIPVRSVGGS